MFARNSYQSLSSPKDSNATTKEPNPNAKDNSAKPISAHKGLHILISVQILFVTLCCLVVVHIESNNSSPWVQTLYRPETRFAIPMLAASVYLLACIGMRCVFPTTHLWMLRIGNVMATLSLALLCAFFAALTVCDPIIRVIRDSDLDRVIVMGPSGTTSFSVYPTMSTPHFIMIPQSELSTIGTGWIAENRPDFFECAALTPYALSGRLMVGLALICFNCAFLVSTSVAFVFKGTFHATPHACVLYCFLFVALVDSIAIVVLNNAVWDWRMLYLGMAAAAGSSYLAASVLFLPPAPVPPPEKTNAAQLLPKPKTPAPSAGVAARATWLFIQPVIALESFFDKLDEPDTQPLADAADASPFPEAQAGYHV